jgi:hypothetical protein
VLENPDKWYNDNIQGRFFTKDFIIWIFFIYIVIVKRQMVNVFT